MSLEYDDCLKRGKIRPFSRGISLASKELDTALSDLEQAKKTYKQNAYKWVTIQLYYSMIHASRALLYAKNLREHSHFCLIVAIRALYCGNRSNPRIFIKGLSRGERFKGRRGLLQQMVSARM